MAKRTVKIEVNLPDLEPADGPELESEALYDSVEFRGLDLGGQEAARCRFMECGLYDCTLDGAVLREVRLTDCVLEGLRAGELDLVGSFWRDVVVTDARFGALGISGSSLERVRFSGGKIDFLNLRGSEVSNVQFEGCRLGEVEVGTAELARVAFVDCRIDKLELGQARLDEVDLSRAELRGIGGISSMAGAIINDRQLADLAEEFAHHLGVSVVPEPATTLE